VDRGAVTVADVVRAEFNSRALESAVAVTGVIATMPYIALQLIGMAAADEDFGRLHQMRVDHSRREVGVARQASVHDPFVFRIDVALLLRGVFLGERQGRRRYLSRGHCSRKHSRPGSGTAHDGLNAGRRSRAATNVWQRVSDPSLPADRA
jgi:hypothetical protein